VSPLNEWRFYSEVSFLLGSVGSGSSTLRTRCREFFSATKARRVFFGPKTNRNLRSAFPDQARLPPTLLLRLSLSLVSSLPEESFSGWWFGFGGSVGGAAEALPTPTTTPRRENQPLAVKIFSYVFVICYSHVDATRPRNTTAATATAIAIATATATAIMIARATATRKLVANPKVSKPQIRH